MSPEIIGLILVAGSYVAISVWTVAVTSTRVDRLQQQADATECRVREIELKQARNQA